MVCSAAGARLAILSSGLLLAAGCSSTGDGAVSNGGSTGDAGAVTGGGSTGDGAVARGGSTGDAGVGGSGGGASPDAALPDPCVQTGACPVGVWTNVTPSNADLTHKLGCDNFGTQSVQVDPNRPSDLYALFMCQGVWKSTDHGLTWTGPVNTGSQGDTAGDCAGGITMPSGKSSGTAIMYAACIRGAGLGFWRSTNSGVDWAHYPVAPGGDRQDFYPPVVDPHDDAHLLMAGHEMNVLVESADGGQSWTKVATNAGMDEKGGTAGIFFIDTGDPATTRKTWLWIAQQSTEFGTWRTTTGGATWTKVDENTHPHGSSQIYQPDGGGVIYMAGVYSHLGWGILRSADHGQSWIHLGRPGNEAIVFGTPKNVYAMNGGAIGLGGMSDPSFQTAAQPGTGAWSAPGTQAAMTLGPAQAAVTSDGNHHIIVTASWGAGLWRYIEP